MPRSMQSPPWPEQSKQGGGFFSPSKALALSRRFLAGVFGNALVVDDASRRKSVGFLAGRAPRRDRPEAAGQRPQLPPSPPHPADQTGRLNFPDAPRRGPFLKRNPDPIRKKTSRRRTRSSVAGPSFQTITVTPTIGASRLAPQQLPRRFPSFRRPPRAVRMWRGPAAASSEKLTFPYLGAPSWFLPTAPFDLPQ